MSELSSETAKKALKDFLGVPFLIFAAAFLIGTILLAIILTPGRFPVRTGATFVRFADLRAEQKALEEKYRSLKAEQDRVSSLTPTPTLNMIHDIRAAAHNRQLGMGIAALTDAVASFNTSIEIDFFHAKDGQISISGKARDGNGRSIPLLASFIDRLRSDRHFKDVSEPEYSQIRDGEGRVYSPFAIEILLTDE